jgi:dTDP-4-amino-4,6-dideoxygalactose transaminase
MLGVKTFVMPKTVSQKTTRASSLDANHPNWVRTISLAEPILGDEEKKALSAVIDSNWLTMGDCVTGFEKAFADLHGVFDAVAVSSCTAGLHLCLGVLEIGPGDEVLVPSLTFVATANAVLYRRISVFVDIESERLPHIAMKDAKAMHPKPKRSLSCTTAPPRGYWLAALR